MKKTRKSAERDTGSAGSMLHKREGKRDREEKSLSSIRNGAAKDAQTTLPE